MLALNTNKTDEELIAAKDIETLYFKYEKLINKMCNKYQDINRLYLKEDLLSECYIILERSTRSYNSDLDNRCSFITYLFNGLNKGLWSIVNGITSKDRGNNNLVVISGDNYINEEGKITIFDSIGINDKDIPEFLFIEDLHKLLDSSLDKLTLKERNNVKAIYGYYSRQYTTIELSEIYGISNKTITASIRNAFRKLRVEPKLINIWNEEYSNRKFKIEYRAAEHRELFRHKLQKKEKHQDIS